MFGEDDFCIDYCQINGQSVDLGLTGVECNENDVDDNDGCAIMTCDFELNQITSMIETPCKQNVYGWNNKTYRVYTVVIDVCEAVGELVDTYSLNPFWIYLENDKLGLSDSFRVSSLGTDGDNMIKVNTTNIGIPDKLYLVHYNNDDVCITDISVDGFEVDVLTFINSEYDCEYSDDGCNVITVDFETNEMNLESIAECPFKPSDFDAKNDKCITDKVDEWVHQLFDFATTAGIISGIALMLIILCCLGCCIWIGYSIQKGRSNSKNDEN